MFRGDVGGRGPLRVPVLQVPAASIQAALQLLEGSTLSLEELCRQFSELFRHAATSSGKENEQQHHMPPMSKSNVLPSGYIRSWICQVDLACLQLLVRWQCWSGICLRRSLDVKRATCLDVKHAIQVKGCTLCCGDRLRARRMMESYQDGGSRQAGLPVQTARPALIIIPMIKMVGTLASYHTVENTSCSSISVPIHASSPWSLRERNLRLPKRFLHSKQGDSTRTLSAV